MFWCQENCPSENCPPPPPENYPQKIGHEKITPYEYSLMKAPPVKTTPQKFAPQKIALYENLRP